MGQTAISVFKHCTYINISQIEKKKKQREKMENNGNEMCNEMPDDTSLHFLCKFFKPDR